MNLLALVYCGEISAEEGQRLFDQILQRIHDGELTPDWREHIEVSNYEATASLHGAEISDLVKLRYDGWPTECSRCGRPLDYRLYSWWFERRQDGSLGLSHLQCNPPS